MTSNDNPAGIVYPSSSSYYPLPRLHPLFSLYLCPLLIQWLIGATGYFITAVTPFTFCFGFITELEAEILLLLLLLLLLFSPSLFLPPPPPQLPEFRQMI